MIEKVKSGGDQFLEKIIALLNLCLETSKILENWNYVIIMLIHKKADTTNLGNYGSVSLLSHLYKLLTKIITKRLENKLDTYQPREQVEF